MVTVKFYDLKKNEDELKLMIDSYSKKGWSYCHPDGGNSEVNYDSRNIEIEVFEKDEKYGSSIRNCIDVCGDRLEVGNIEHILASRKLDFFNVIYNLHGSEYLVSEKNLRERLNIK